MHGGGGHQPWEPSRAGTSPACKEPCLQPPSAGLSSWLHQDLPGTTSSLSAFLPSSSIISVRMQFSLPRGSRAQPGAPPPRQQHRLLAPCRMTFLPQTADERVSAHLLRISPKLCQQGNETGPRSPSLAAAVSHLQPVRPSVRLSVLQSCPAPGRCRSLGALQQNAREMSRRRRRRRRLRAGMLPSAAPGPSPMGRAWVCSRNSQIEGCYPNTQTLQTSDYGTHQFFSFPGFLKSSSSS